MPQIDKVLFLPQIIGSFIVIVLFFIFLIKFASLLLSSVFKVRFKMADTSIVTVLKVIRNTYKTRSVLLINNTLALKQSLLDFKFKY